ncbi:MAG: CoA-binding protein [Isosphaeraceae bacterium]
MSAPSVAVIGASNDRTKFGNKAVRAYRDSGFQVDPINPNASEVEGLPAFATVNDVLSDRLDRVSFYVPPKVVLAVLDQIANQAVGEVWLNPGTDTAEVVQKAEALGLNVVQGCSIVGLGLNPGQYGS